MPVVVPVVGGVVGGVVVQTARVMATYIFVTHLLGLGCLVNGVVKGYGSFFSVFFLCQACVFLGVLAGLFGFLYFLFIFMCLVILVRQIMV